MTTSGMTSRRIPAWYLWWPLMLAVCLLWLLLRLVSLLLLLIDIPRVPPFLARQSLLAHLDEHRHEHNTVLRWLIIKPA